MDQFKTYTIADIEAERKRVRIKINDLCRAIGIDRQQYHRNRVSGRIWLDRANAMLKFIYAQEKAKEKERERA